MGHQWMELQQWVFPAAVLPGNLKVGEGGEEGAHNDIVRETFERTGASVMGRHVRRREQMWPEEAPFHTRSFVVTHEKRDPWERPGGTPSTSSNDGISPRSASPRGAGDPDVRIAGGGATILEYVNAGLITSSRSRSHPCCSAPESACRGVDAGRVALEPVARSDAAVTT